MCGGIKGVAEYWLSLLIIRLFGAMTRRVANRAAQTFAGLGFHHAMRQRDRDRSAPKSGPLFHRSDFDEVAKRRDFAVSSDNLLHLKIRVNYRLV
jgi:hypothetical protein